LDGESIAAADVFVLCHSSADAAILAVCDLPTGSVNFNGDDAVEFKCGATTLDVLGQIGVDPGNYWGSGDCTTQNHTLVRKPTVHQGDPIGNDAFDPSVEWLCYPEDTFTYLGSHEISK
jgi:hypothetical protein